MGRATRPTATSSWCTSSPTSGSATTWPWRAGRTSGSTRGFATYAEWLWEEHEGRGTPQEIFQATYDAIPANNAFWTVEIGDPGVDLLFHDAVYVRGAMTLQALRQTVGDDAFWRIIRGWASTKSGGNATTEEFIAFAEGVSGQQLDDLFTTWLFTPTKPSLAGQEAGAAALSAPSGAPAADWWPRAQAQHDRGRF
jgi:aminopeptidase N